MVRTYSFDSFSLPFNVLLFPRFAAEAQNSSLSNPAGHSYSNVSNAHVQNNHSLLETVQITVWIDPNFCPGIQMGYKDLSCGRSPYIEEQRICWPGQLSTFDTTDENILSWVQHNIRGACRKQLLYYLCVICCCVKQAEISCCNDVTLVYFLAQIRYLNKNSKTPPNNPPKNPNS